MNLKFIGKQKEAWKDIDVSTHILLSRDLKPYRTKDPKTNELSKWKYPKDFTSILYEKIDYLCHHLENNNIHMYEILPPDQPVKPYFDIEIEDYNKITNKFCEKVNKIYYIQI